MAHETTNDNVELADALAKVYAKSLFDLATDQGACEEVADELSQIVQLLDGTPDLKAVFSVQSIHPSRRADTIEKIFKGQVTELTYHFMQVLNDKGRLGHLSPIRYAYDQLLKAEHGEVDVDLYLASALDEKQLADVTDRISKAIGRTAVVHTRIDEQMIGGLKLRVGDRLIDGSVATQLRRMKQQLIDNGLEKIRQNMSEMIEE